MLNKNKLTEYPHYLFNKVKRMRESTVMLIVILIATFIFVISFSMLIHKFSNEVKSRGGARQVIVDMGKEVKSVLDDINKEELKEEVRR